MTMITPSYLGETIEYSSLHACRSTLEDPTGHSPGLQADDHDAGRVVDPLDHFVGHTSDGATNEIGGQ